jgi:hypothetical protein
MTTKSRQLIYGASVRAASERAEEAPSEYGLRPCIPEFTSAFGSMADVIGIAAGSARSRMTRTGLPNEQWLGFDPREFPKLC